jgi:hypothetical protein
MADVFTDLLAARPDLPARIREWIDEAVKRHPLTVPEVQVEYPGQETPAKKAATTVVIKRGDPKAEPPPADPTEPLLIVWVNSKEIDLEHVRLEYKDGVWMVSAKAAGVTCISEAANKRFDVASGRTLKMADPEFTIRIRSFRFSLKSANTRPAAVASLSRTRGPAAPEPGALVTDIRVLGSWLTLTSPKDFWHRRENSRVQILQELWDSLAGEFNIAPRPDLEFPDASPSTLPSRPERFTIQLDVGSVARAFQFDVAESFARLLLERARNRPLQVDQLTGEIRWGRLICIGEQELTLGQLKTVGPTKVVVLKPDSGFVADTQFSRRWALTSSGPKLYRIGPEIRTPIQNGGFMPESPNVGQLQVKLQVVLTSKDMNLGDVQRFAPGQDIPLDVQENAEVSIAINGQILGAGKLVRTGEGRVGVRILNWNL